MGIFQRKAEKSSPSSPGNSLKRRSSVENKKRKQGHAETDTEKWPHSISSQEQESKKEQEYNLQNNNIAPAAVIPEDQAPAKDFQDPPVPLGKPLAPNFDFDNPSANASFVVRVKPRSARDPYSKRKAQFERKLKLDSIDETDAGSGTSSEATPRTSARFSSGSEDDWGESSTREIQAEINIVPERLDSLTERVESAKVSDEPESPGLFPEGLSDFPEVSESPYRESLERHDPPERPETSERHESSERPKSSERPRSREVTEHLEDPNILDRMDSPLLPEEHGSHDSSFNSLERQRADSPDFNELSDNDETEPDDIIIMGRQRSTSPESIEAPILESQESSSATDSPRNSLEVINRSDPIATDRPTHRAKPSRYDDSDARKDKDLTREERAEALRTKVINMGNRTRMDMGFSDVKDVGVGTRKDFGINTDTDVSIEASIEAVTDLFNDALGEKVMATQTGDSLRLTSDRTTLISSALSQVYVVDSQVGPDGPPFYVNGHNGLINDNKTDSEIGTITEDTVGLASTPPHTKKRSDRMWMCIIAVLTMVILGIIASGIAIYFAVRATEARKEAGKDFSVYSTYYLGMRIRGKPYHPILQDQESKEFSFLETDICSFVRVIYSSSTLASSYQSCSVLDFRSGSIIVSAKLNFDRDLLRQREELVSAASVSETLVRYMKYYLDEGSMPDVLTFKQDYDPEVSSIKVVRFYHELSDTGSTTAPSQQDTT